MYGPVLHVAFSGVTYRVAVTGDRSAYLPIPHMD
jgi:hypothetical protein